MLSLSDYKLLNCLHEGSSSNIYRALCISDQSPVVIKVSTQKTLTEKKIQRFRREFALGQQIHSPHVIRYLALQQDSTYGIALVMEDDQAVALSSVIPPSGFSNQEFLAMAIQIVHGLQAIHGANIIHNDLKPSNILIQPMTHAIKIIDFNQASSLRQEMQAAIPMLGGSLAYISPELTGRVNRSIDYRTDFYSLGVTFYQLLCGQLPFMAKDALGLIYQHLAKQPIPPHHCKPVIALPLSHMVMKLLQKEAENRYQSCEGILHDLTVCRSALEETGTIPAFELGQEDFSNKLTLSQHLYGREREIKILLNAFERISEGKPEVLMVAGQPGVGKTMLIQEIQKPITLKQGYFLTGKFDQLNKNVAYSAVAQAFNGLIQQWLTEDETSIILWKKRLLAALGTQAPLIIKIIPALALLIDEQPEISIADMNQAKNVLNLIFQEFIKACATASHPLVIFLDDLQWADPASLELMTYLLQQPNISHLLWIGAYRDTEVTTSHPALQTIKLLQEAEVCVQTIKLSPLPLSSLCQWISDSFHKPVTEVQPLAELIFQKTEGNPFFVKLFLQSLYDQQLLTLSPQTHWQWELDKIYQHPATENVITLMTYQIQQLPYVTQQALSIASCLGHRLTLSTLQTAMADSPEVVSEALQPAVNSGILIQTESEVYFAHDRVQEAAYCLPAEEEKPSIHCTIGQRLWASSASEEVLLLDIVAQFNYCRSLVTDAQERLRIARLNLKAEQKAKQAIAYASALDYLYASQDWIDTKALWKTDYPLAFALHKELAEMEYLNGHIDSSQAIIADMQPHLASIMDKVEIYHLLINQKIVLGQPKEAIALGHQALQLLGTGLPLDNPTDFIQREMPLLKERLAGISLPDLLNAPRVLDPEKQAIIKILADLIGACYQIGPELLPVTTLMAINLSLSYGHVPESCVSYGVYGSLLCTQSQEYALGYAFGDLAIRLAEKLKSPVQCCRSKLMMFGFISVWSKSIQALPARLASTFEECLACGEIEYADYCGYTKVQMLFDQGANLEKVQQQIISNLQFAYTTKAKGIIYIVMRGFQKVVANLMGETKDKEDFSYNNVSEMEFESVCQSASGMAIEYYIRKAQALYLYGHFEQALQYLSLARSKLVYILGFFATAHFNWYDSLSRLALYPIATAEEQQAYLQQVAQNQQQMKIWQASCPGNFAHKYFLVKAELAQIHGHYEQAEAYYDQAITLADRNGFIQEQAVAAELAAKYWLMRGKSTCAQGYLNIAFNGYKQWGAKRKLMEFKAQYADLLKTLAPTSLSQLAINHETTLSANTLKFLDLSSILKASHAISSEIELPKLLRGMMQIIIENAGAQQGAVLFVEAEDIAVQAEYASDGSITTLQKIPLAAWTHGAPAVIQYVKRLQQTVVVDDAMTDEKFKADSYISRTQTKSILCIPFLKQMELRAILYLENNLMSHAFTPERVQTVLILTAQMAISLENSRYFAEQIALTRQLDEQSARAEVAEESLHAVTHDLQLALEASKAGTWNLQIDSQQATWDAGNYALFGLTPGEFKGTYAAVLERVHPEDRERLSQEVKRCIEQGIPHDMEYRVVWPDGSQHVISAQGRVYRDHRGCPVKMAGVCLDITQRRQLEQERLAALKKVEEAEKELNLQSIRRAIDAEERQKKLEEFVDTICHEVRNPLNIIYGGIALLREDFNFLAALHSKKFAERMNIIKSHLKSIEKASKQQKAVIDDVLNLSRLEHSSAEINLVAFELKRFLTNMLQMFHLKFEEKKLKNILNMPDKKAIWLKGDKHYLKRILINLISNAIKFTDKGSITTTITTEPLPENNVILHFSVKDTGIGIQANEIEHIFDRFAPISRRKASSNTGSGLGLAISKKLVDLMDGTISVQSQIGIGSEFSFTVKCSYLSKIEKQEILASRKKISQPEEFVHPSANIKGKKILIVEDNTMNQKVLATYLAKAECISVIANDGLEALEKYAQNSFDLIFMDIEMPNMNGLEATEEIRAQEQKSKFRTPIIGLTAYTSQEYQNKALSSGMDHCISKPCNQATIYSLIRQYTRSDHSLKSSPSLTPQFLHYKDNIAMSTTASSIKEINIEEIITQFRYNAAALLAENYTFKLTSTDQQCSMYLDLEPINLSPHMERLILNELKMHLETSFAALDGIHIKLSSNHSHLNITVASVEQAAMLTTLLLETGLLGSTEQPPGEWYCAIL